MNKNSISKRANKIREHSFVKLLIQFGDGLKEDNINAYASSCAFFIFLSLVPTIIVVCSILPYTPLKQQDLTDMLTRLIPDTMSGIVVSIVDEVYGKSVGILSIAIITALWSAGKGVNALIVGLNAIEHEDPRKNSIITRFFASVYTLIFMAMVIIFLILVVYGKNAMEFMSVNYPSLAELFGIFLHFRNLISILFTVIVFMVLYAELPNKKMKIREQVIGAVFTSLSWNIFSTFFSLYVRNTDAFSVYGSFTTIIVMLIWLYICMYLVFFGANLNKYLRPITNVIHNSLREKKKGGNSDEEENANADD